MAITRLHMVAIGHIAVVAGALQGATTAVLYAVEVLVQTLNLITGLRSC